MADEFSLESFRQEYDTETTDMTIRSREFQFLLPCSLDRFINTDNLFQHFPLWAKIWEASWILADYMAGASPDSYKRILEIGGGIGLVSITAAAFGHRITMTESDTHAVKFAKANAALNGVNDLECFKLDWNKPSLSGRFDMIIASEVVYKEKDFKPLENLFKTYRAPRGEIVLASGMRNTTMAFLNHMSQTYDIDARKKILRSEEDEEKVTVVLARMTPKQGR
ncbi:MAG TPA: methyltransferase [Deltaproteobacteria bacterium]|nr:methyltransferase [Deltaproteobacteria bacterium]